MALIGENQPPLQNNGMAGIPKRGPPKRVPLKRQGK